MTPARIVRVFGFSAAFACFAGFMIGEWGSLLGAIVGAAVAWPGP